MFEIHTVSNSLSAGTQLLYTLLLAITGLQLLSSFLPMELMSMPKIKGAYIIY
jgi:hypothetical protein